MQSDWGMVLPEHLSYFTTKTLSEVLTRNGLEKIFLKTENISFYRIMEYLNKEDLKASLLKYHTKCSKCNAESSQSEYFLVI